MPKSVSRMGYYLILCLAVIFSSEAHAQSYNITDLGGVVGTNSYAHGINNQGQVVGYWIGTNGARAFLYSSGTVTDLGALGGTNNYALSINAAGQVVGFAESTNGAQAFLFSQGTMTNLGSLGGRTAMPTELMVMAKSSDILTPQLVQTRFFIPAEELPIWEHWEEVTASRSE